MIDTGWLLCFRSNTGQTPRRPTLLGTMAFRMLVSIAANDLIYIGNKLIFGSYTSLVALKSFPRHLRHADKLQHMQQACDMRGWTLSDEVNGLFKVGRWCYKAALGTVVWEHTWWQKCDRSSTELWFSYRNAFIISKNKKIITYVRRAWFNYKQINLNKTQAESVPFRSHCPLCN